MENKKIALIAGGGPAGLTTALELLNRTDIKPIVFEFGDDVGGIARTYNHNGNRIDLGGHRFFSKSDRVMNWWQEILPLDPASAGNSSVEIAYQNKKRTFSPQAQSLENPDDIMLLRPRVSRILYRRQFFDYPISLSFDTLRKLGFLETIKIGFSYIYRRLFQIKPEKSLEDFIINRFGFRLYATFFRDYTEKVWGVPCPEIPAEWGAQRIKGVSITAVLKHAFKKIFGKKDKSVDQKGTETSLIEQFLYPKFGPGQMWQKVSKMVQEKGGEVHLEYQVIGLKAQDNKVVSMRVKNRRTGEEKEYTGDYFFSTMPVRTLARILPGVPEKIKSLTEGLPYRDFMTVGLLADRLELGGGAVGTNLREKLPDNWIYIQEPDVMVGRLQVFNNWSPFMVADPNKVWIGLEYFLNKKDELWNRDDKKIIEFAKDEMQKIGVLKKENVSDAVVIRTPKAYPAYFGTYDHFDQVKDYFNIYENLFLLGRNGMHRYNNQDHSMLTAMTSVDNIIAGIKDKTNIWAVNTEQEYHEEK